MNMLMKQKMDMIQVEMTKFREKNDTIVNMCDDKMRQLIQQIEMVTSQIEIVVN